MKLGLCVLATCMLSACANFREVHYFKTIDNAGNPVNYYRLTITGQAGLSRANYVSGYYDETAVDLLFNESRSGVLKNSKPYVEIPPPAAGNAPTPGVGGGTQAPVPAHAGAAAAPAAAAAGVPAPAPAGATAAGAATPEDKAPAPPKAAAGTNEEDQFTVANGNNGAFVMIFSTNADAVADTIGNFADSSITAQAITNLVNQSQLRTIQANSSQQLAVSRQATATSEELTALLAQIPTGDMPQSAATTEAYLRFLSAISRALGSGQNFQTITEAEIWFKAARLSIGGQ